MSRGEALDAFRKATRTGEDMDSVIARLVGSVSPLDGPELARLIRAWRP